MNQKFEQERLVFAQRKANQAASPVGPAGTSAFVPPPPQRLHSIDSPELPGPTAVEAWENQQARVGKIQRFVCNKFGEFARNGLPSSGKLTLKDVTFYDCDLSKVDFSTATLSNVYFQGVDIAGARFSQVKDYGSSGWDDTAWWLASEIDGGLLKMLMDQYPAGLKDWDGSHDTPTDTPTRAQYVARVLALCRPARISCQESDIKYGKGS